MHPPDPLHLCDEPGCEYRGQHYDNCPDCYGWGHLDYDAPIRGGDVEQLRSRALVGPPFEPLVEPTPCPTCGSTVEGAGLAGGPIEAVAVSRNKRSRGPC